MQREVLSRVRSGWVDVRRNWVPRSGQHALRLVAVVLLVQRSSYIAGAVTNSWSHGATHVVNPAANAAAIGVAVAWNGWLTVAVWRRGWITERLLGVDVLVTVALLFAQSHILQTAFATSTENWARKFVMATAATAGAVLALRRALALVALVLLAALAALVVHTGALPPLTPGFLDLANWSMWFALALYFVAKQARAADEATQRHIEARAARAADRARFAERLQHHRALHDTVLATLTAIARGGLDHRSEAVRQRCAADADYIRRLVAAEEEEEASPSTLGCRLARVAADAGALGLRVNLYVGELPAWLSHRAAEAMSDACREALNNVAKHAGVQEAWLTTEWTGRRLTVRVVDRGCGFDPDITGYGFGLRHSIGERMREVGGELLVFSMPGEGTSVELALDAVDAVQAG
ncbi:sensor histidine kinase [Actinoplanes regularis]|uniref:Signal transduction histidine kinase n=1 Tax=Actinoplanes regularis TaxID=52697 RepID=A0A239IHD0_9ACTN|nr:ATP-binding protein [Actinoplanes regularis]SNS93017.1 Signal transduction histidine kinase [Actinoplanes regularis]